MREKIKQILIEENKKLSRYVPHDGMYNPAIERILDVLQEEISKRS
jgi:hypothetical protein